MNTNTVVSRCEATNCRFNEDLKCTAGQIEVSLNAQKAECLTFSPQADAQATRPSAQQ